jgi:RND family efflux transporter MFP subunit
VAQAAQTMFQLAEDGARDAVFQFYEAAFLHKSASADVSLSLVSQPQITARGILREVSPSTDSTSGTVRVKVSIVDPPPQFALGSVISGCSKLMPREVVILPATALTSAAGDPAVWIVDPKSFRVSLKRVSVTAYESQSVVIDNGLEPGDQVVTAGAKLLRPGQAVEISTEEES